MIWKLSEVIAAEMKEERRSEEEEGKEGPTSMREMGMESLREEEMVGG